MTQPIQKFVLKLMVFCVILALIPHWSSSALAQAGNSDYTFGDCSKIDKEQLRDEIERVAHDVLTDESAGLDIETTVMRKWVAINVDATINSEVERAINKVYNDESYWSRLWSGWSSEKAEEFATKIAADAFGSETFHTKITELSAAIAAEISTEIEANFARAASAAFLCMKAYVGEKYSQTLFGAFENKVSVEVKEANVQAATEVNVSALDVHKKALGGVGVIVVTEISRRLAVKLSEKIAERIAGKIAGRVLGRVGSSFVPVAGWVIGLGLIVWDLWEGGKGALPQIQDALQSEEIKAKIRQEVTDSIKFGLPEEVSIVALEIAVNIVEEWDNFCVRNQDVCAIALENSTFQEILDFTPLDQVEKLTTLIDIFTEQIGRANLDNAISNGQFETLLGLPSESYAILQATKSVSTTLAWADLAGDQLDKVVEYNIYSQKQPNDFDQSLLHTLLNTSNAETVEKLLPLPRADLEKIVAFAGGNFVRLAHRLSSEELGQLAGYLNTTSAPPSQEVAAELASGAMSVAALIDPTLQSSTALSATNPFGLPPWLAGVIDPNGWQFLYVNSVVIASSLLLVAVVLFAYVTRRGRKSDDAPSKKTQTKPSAKPRPQVRRKPRDVYDIFHDDES